MKETRIVLYMYMLLCIVAIMVGCNVNNTEEKDERLSLIAKTDPDPVTLVSHQKEKNPVADLKKDIEEAFDEIYDVAVIRGEKHTLIVYKVKHMQRFFMKRIEKKLNALLENHYPDEDFIVSSDYKIFLEAIKLGKKMEDPNFSNKEANKELERIIKLKKELT